MIKIECRYPDSILVRNKNQRKQPVSQPIIRPLLYLNKGSKNGAALSIRYTITITNTLLINCVIKH